MDYKQLYSLNVNEHTEKKNGLTYLSWAWAWQKILEHCPTATYEILKNENGIPAFGNAELGYMVYTRVTIENITHEMWLPVMDNNNKTMKASEYTYDTRQKQGIKVEAIDMFAINKAIMRCLTKNLAMFGLGLYIYSGEDLPTEEADELKSSVKKVALDDLLKKAESKGVTKEQLIEAVNKGTPDKEHITDVSQLSEGQIIGLNKKLDLKK